MAQSSRTWTISSTGELIVCRYAITQAANSAGSSTIKSILAIWWQVRTAKGSTCVPGRSRRGRRGEDTNADSETLELVDDTGRNRNDKIVVKNEYHRLLNVAGKKGFNRGWVWRGLTEKFSEDQLRCLPDIPRMVKQTHPKNEHEKAGWRAGRSQCTHNATQED